MPLISKFERLNHDAMHRWHGAYGVGAVSDYIPFWPSERETDPCAPSPAWCDWPLIPDAYIKECQPIDPARCQVTGFGPALSTESRQTAIEQGQIAQDAYLRMNPQEAQAYNDYMKRKACIDSGRAPFLCDFGTYIFWGSAALVGALLITRR
jgi:hypothetical protein